MCACACVCAQVAEARSSPVLPNMPSAAIYELEARFYAAKPPDSIKQGNNLVERVSISTPSPDTPSPYQPTVPSLNRDR